MKTWCLQIWGVNTLSCLQYKNIIVDKNQSIPYFPPHCGIQCSIPSKVCPLRKRLPLSCHKNRSQIFDATKLCKHTISLTYNTKTLISNISETYRFSPQMRPLADNLSLKITLKNHSCPENHFYKRKCCTENFSVLFQCNFQRCFCLTWWERFTNRIFS